MIDHGWQSLAKYSSAGKAKLSVVNVLNYETLAIDIRRSMKYQHNLFGYYICRL